MNRSGPLFARLAGKVLVDAPPAASVARADRAQTIDVIGRALREKARRKRLRVRLFYGVAAAAVLGAGATRWATSPHEPPRSALSGAARSVEGAVTVTFDGRARPLVEGTTVGAGDRIAAREDSRAVLALTTGTRLVVEGGGDFAIDELGAAELFRLAAGSVRADVAKLVRGERFIIRTSDAEVEVQGTSFVVQKAASDPTCGAGTTTHVAVYEGIVTVRTTASESRVGPGESWPFGCVSSGALAAPSGSVTATSAPEAPPPSTPPHGTFGRAADGHVAAEPGARAASGEPTTAPERPRSDLAAQNDLFDHGVDAKRRGDTATALASFQELLTKYPSSPLAEAAAAERMKLLALTGGPSAEGAARSYLARYPAGFARSDAERILGAR
jgi:hypothetical protein